MKKGICYIVGAGEGTPLDFNKNEEDYIIAADAGYRYLKDAGMEADMVIGDYDSIEKVPEHRNLILLPKEKDDTDSLAALRKGLELGYETFCFYCCTGGRIDHTLANIQLLAYLSKQGKRGYLFGRDTVMTMVTNGSVTIDKKGEGYVSVFSYSERSTGVNLRGMKYILNDAEIDNTFPIGVSNEFAEEHAVIEVGMGTLLITYPYNGK